MVCTLAKVRKAKGVTQTRLAEMTKINRVSIAKYETGRVIPSVRNVMKLAEALGVCFSDIIKDD